jgi:hypothetical protein
MSARFTKIDWDIINTALAAMEAMDMDSGELGDYANAAGMRRLGQTREKVWSMLDRTNPGWSEA